MSTEESPVVTTPLNVDGKRAAKVSCSAAASVTSPGGGTGETAEGGGSDGDGAVGPPLRSRTELLCVPGCTRSAADATKTESPSAATTTANDLSRPIAPPSHPRL